jgi:hypothetical protein
MLKTAHKSSTKSPQHSPARTFSVKISKTTTPTGKKSAKSKAAPIKTAVDKVEKIAKKVAKSPTPTLKTQTNPATTSTSKSPTANAAPKTTKKSARAKSNSETAEITAPENTKINTPTNPDDNSTTLSNIKQARNNLKLGLTTTTSVSPQSQTIATLQTQLPKINRLLTTPTVCAPGTIQVEDESDPVKPLFPKNINPLMLFSNNDINSIPTKKNPNLTSRAEKMKFLLNLAQIFKYDVLLSTNDRSNPIPSLVLPQHPKKLLPYKSTHFSMVPDMPVNDFTKYNSIVLFGGTSNIEIVQTYSDLISTVPIDIPIFIINDAILSGSDTEHQSVMRVMNDAHHISSVTFAHACVSSPNNPHWNAVKSLIDDLPNSM